VVVGLNKFAILVGSVLFLLILFCNQDSQALASAHSRRHKTTQFIPSESNKAAKHFRSKRYSSAPHSTKHKTKISKNTAPKTRYAYPMGTFLMEPPTFEATPLPEEISTQIKKAFYSGNAGEYPTRSLVRAGIASYYPMRGGIFWRREPIKYLIMHSTEPGIPVGAKTIVDCWSHGGKRHAGAHYVIDRDGTIYQAVDPDLATVHINIFKTLPGINNDNSVGIEMCHTGSQDYPPALMESACRLAAYLQSHYHIADANIITHRYAQQGDHTDPVNFAWDSFIFQKETLQSQGLNQRLALLKTQIFNWQPLVEQPTIIVEDKKSKSHKPPKVEPPRIIEVQAKPIAKPENPSIVEIQTKPVTKLVAPGVIEVQAKPATKSVIPSVSEVQAKPANQSAFETKFGSIYKPTSESAFEAKFGSPDKSDFSIIDTSQPISKPAINKPAIESAAKPVPTMQTVLSAPIPSGGSNVSTNITVPMDSSPNPNHLMPTPAATRLVPVTMTINTQPNNNAISRPANKPMPDVSYPNPSTTTQINQSTTEKRSPRLLPLRGPIEMEPDEASLLSQ
jgi:hypothetical protein